MRNFKAVFLTFTVFSVGVYWACAQPPLDPKPLPVMPPPPKEDVEKIGPILQPGGQMKDPTTASEKLKGVLNPLKAGAGGAAAAIPPVSLRGRIIFKDKPPTAVLEIGKSLYVVNVGSVVPTAGGVTLKVLAINADDVQIEVAPLKQILNLR